MKNIPTFEQFINESRLNEGLTVAEYIKLSKDADDDFWVGLAETAAKKLKLAPNKALWISSEDDDPKYGAIQEYWISFSDHQDVSREFEGESFKYSRKGNILFYEEQGVSAYILADAVYRKL